jgi:hypothetical protein
MITNTYFQIVTSRDEMVLIRERERERDEEREVDRDEEKDEDEEKEVEREREREVDREREREVDREITLLEDVVSQYLFQLNDIYKQINILRIVEKERITSWISCHDALKEAKDAEEHTVRLYNSVVTRLCGVIEDEEDREEDEDVSDACCGKIVEPIPVYIWKELPNAALHPIEL